MQQKGLPGGAKNSQRNLGLQVASEDVAPFANSVAKENMGGKTRGERKAGKKRSYKGAFKPRTWTGSQVRCGGLL